MLRTGLAGAAGIALAAALGSAAPASAADPIAYPISDLAAAFLSDADIKALAPWGSFQPTTPEGTECSSYADGGYVCLRDYPTHQFGSRPYYLKVISMPDAAKAEREFALAQASATAASVSTLASDASSFSVVRRDYDSTPYRVVTSGRLAGNHYIEAACWGAADRYRVEDINTCTQLMVSAQADRLSDLVSPRLEPPGSPTDVLVDAEKGRVTVTWLAPEATAAPRSRTTAPRRRPAASRARSPRRPPPSRRAPSRGPDLESTTS